MGEIGPCGPCSEIFYDHGEHIPGGPPGSPDADLDRYVEIWNLVFMQYERKADGSLVPLPKPSVDTGMGLERIAAVMQGVHNNYDIDLFQQLIHAAKQLATTEDMSIHSLRVIADHIRSSSFLMVDGVLPSNEGRGYVLRRIIRRAIRHGHQLGMPHAFLTQLVATLAQVMGEAYPQLVEKQELIQQILERESEQFAETLERGLHIFEQRIATLSDKTIPGDLLFKLYDTYGFPVDLVADIARERNLNVDTVGFEQAMQQQRSQSQQQSQFSVDHAQLLIDEQTQFTGHHELKATATIIGLFKDNQPVNQLTTNENGFVVLNQSPFYPEGGGQVGDRGVLQGDKTKFNVQDTRSVGNAIVHHGIVEHGILTLGDDIIAEVNANIRQATTLNHSATHLLHAALRELFGTHIEQKGSLVDSKRLRFDFTHFSALTVEQMATLEYRVNEKIRENMVAEAKFMPLNEAKQQGAIALFSEKYGQQVRVLQMGNFSIELCGGTHVQRTGDIGLFKIVAETAVAAGVRRIEAVTGEYALQWLTTRSDMVQQCAEQLKIPVEEVVDKLQQQLQQLRLLQKQLDQLKAKLVSQDSVDLTQQVQQVSGINLLFTPVEQVDAKALRQLMDQLKQRLQKAVVALAVVNEGKVSMVVGVTDNCTDKIRANDVIKQIADKINGRGGGRADMAQGGGTQADNLEQALQHAMHWTRDQLSSV